MKKALIIATVVKKHIEVFHLPYMKWLQENGYEVHVCAKNDYEEKKYHLNYCDVYYDLDFSRNPLSKNNIFTYFELVKIIKENNYDIIHCHTPVGGFLGRVASRKTKNINTKVFYTAHGFHFFSGSHLKSWLFYYPVEKILSRYTDVLVTINQEDFQISRNKFKAKKNVLINGVGVDLTKYHPVTQTEKKYLRKKNNLSIKDFILVYVAEISRRKNHYMLINAMNELKKNSEIKLLVIGDGDLIDEIKGIIENKSLEKQIILLGYRRDINELMQLADVCVSSSKQEGLPVNILEAMGVGLPIIATDCRGNRDLVRNGENGYLVPIDDYIKMAKKIETLYANPNLVEEFSQKSLGFSKKYELNEVLASMVKEYN